MEWKWGSNYSSATATPTCSGCGYHKPAVNATITSRVEAVGTIYTATVTIDGTTYTDEQIRGNATVSYNSATYNPNTNSVEEIPQSTNEYFVVTQNSTTWSDNTYVVKGNVTISERIKVSGNVNLILCDGATLTAQKGIETDSDAMLNIYAQSAGTGKLSVKGKDGDHLLLDYISPMSMVRSGENGDIAVKGNVTIYGGAIQAIGGNGYYADHDPHSNCGTHGGDGGTAFCGNITVYKGNIKAAAGSAAEAGSCPPGDGISGSGGSGGSGLEGNVTIYGGTFDLVATKKIKSKISEFLEDTFPTDGAIIKASQAVIYGGTFTNGEPFTKRDAVAPTYTTTGTVEHYLDTAGNPYLKDGYTYTQTTVEGITVPKITLTYHAAVEPICSNGNIEYWHDETNQKYFSDPNGEHEVQSIIAPHSDYAPVWEWGENHTSAQAVFICERCGRQNKIDATVSQNKTNDNTVYTAECTYEGKRYTSTVYTQSIAYQTANYDASQNQVNFSSQETAHYYRVDQNSTGLSGTYVVTGNVTIDAPIAVLGNVDLIICDGATLTVNQGMEVKDGYTLNVYSQSAGTGKLIVNGKNGTDYTTEAVSGHMAISGNIIIHGCNVEVIGGRGSNGTNNNSIKYGHDGGSGASAVSGSITVYDGTVTVTGGIGGIGGIGVGAAADGGNGGSGAMTVDGEMNAYGGTLVISAGNGGAGGTGGWKDGRNGSDGEVFNLTKATICGSPDFTNGFPFTKVDAVEATYTKEGNIEYYTTANGKVYVKSENTYIETTREAVTTRRLPIVTFNTMGHLQVVLLQAL